MSHNKNLLTLILVNLLAAKFSEASTTPTYVPGPSSGKISGAPGQVLPATPPSVDLSSTNAPSDNYNPANDNPGLYSGLPMQMPEGLTQAPEAFWKRDALFGDPYGIRNKISNYGFDFSPVYTGEVFGNASGGMKQGMAYDHSLNLPLTIYLDKVANWWEGGTVHANAMWIAGHSLSADKVGDISGVSNIAGDPALRLQELWYQQSFWVKRASIKVGVLAADAEFFTSDSASLFINGTFGAFTLVGANLPDPAVYPMAAPGARFLIQPIPQFYFQAGIYDGTTEDQDVNKSGVDFHVSRGDGALIFSEIGWLVNQAPTERGLIGTYKLGAFVHTADFPDNITGEDKGANFGVYGVADQELYKHGGKVISAFVRGGGGPADVNTVDWYFDAGFNFSGFIPGRLLDTAGIAVARSNFSSDFSDAQVIGGSNAFSQETVIEATYKAQVSPWWTVQPDFQYIFNPSGEKGSHDAAIIGVRTSLTF
ncbi:MAG TPA: carbohydrate porin [Verrucomicrobiae bacterium]|nr:carbohydrate porin [Verrucomicrobiae bacterium]